MDKKIILWSIALFFGCTILFKAVHEATVGESAGIGFAAQAGTLVLVLAVVVAIAKRRQKP